jgi:hypothetical protein
MIYFNYQRGTGRGYNDKAAGGQKTKMNGAEVRLAK